MRERMRPLAPLILPGITLASVHADLWYGDDTICSRAETTETNRMYQRYQVPVVIIIFCCDQVPAIFLKLRYLQ